MVFDQAKSQFGIAKRTDINYGDILTPNIAVQLPDIKGAKVQCLIIYRIIDGQDSGYN
ncbi:12878_t:CDS:2, partial [Gigaspora margarita]